MDFKADAADGRSGLFKGIVETRCTVSLHNVIPLYPIPLYPYTFLVENIS